MLIKVQISGCLTELRFYLVWKKNESCRQRKEKVLDLLVWVWTFQSQNNMFRITRFEWIYPAVSSGALYVSCCWQLKLQSLECMLNISLGNALVVIEIIALYKNRWDSSRIKHRLNTVETYTRNEENAKAFQAWFKNQSNQNIFKQPEVVNRAAEVLHQRCFMC